MNTPLSWIKAYVPDLDCTDQEYTDAMTLTGTKVEGFERLDKNLDKIIVGKILEIAPHPDARLGWLQARLDTRRGKVSALWVCGEDGVRCELETPVRTLVCLNGKEEWVDPGKYTFWTAE